MIEIKNIFKIFKENINTIYKKLLEFSVYSI